MASKVNTRFVIILAGVLVAIVGAVAGVAVFVSMKSGERYVALGDQKMAAGDYTAAEKFYSIAVNKEQQNVPWLLKWREALSKKVPASETIFRDDYRWYLACHRQLAVAQKTDVEAHREYLELLLREAMASGAAREVWVHLADETDTMLRYFEGTPEESGWPILRRYRGLAHMTIQSLGMEITPAKVEQAREDLETALGLDPKDTAAAAALAAYHRVRADAARQARDTQGEQRHLAESHRLIAEARAADPRDPLPIITAMAQRVDDSLRQVDMTRPTAEVAAQRRQRLEALRPAIEETLTALLAADPDRLDLTRIVQFLSIADTIDSGTASDVGVRLIERVLSVRPEAADLAFMKGRLLVLRGESESAIAQLQRILDMPMPPVGFEGLRLFGLQQAARFWQANAALALVIRAPEGTERRTALTRARNLRNALAAQVAENAPELAFIDGKLRLAEADAGIAPTEISYRAALKLFDEYCRVTGDATLEAAEALTLAAAIADRLGEPGRAADYYRRALARRPGAVTLRMALAEIRTRLNQFPAAIELYRDVLAQDPENTTAKRQLEILRALQQEGGQVEDPITNVLVQADRLYRGTPTKLGDPDAAIAVVESAMGTHNADARLVNALVNMRLARNDRAGALAAIERGLAARPDDTTLLAARRRIEASGSLEESLRLVDESPGSELDKLVQKYLIYRQHGRADEATRTLAQAAGAAPNDPRVVEYQFLEALERKDFDAATRLADRAAAADMDLADGLTYRARVQITRGNLREADVTLRQAIDRRGPSAGSLRLLGNVQMQLGRTLQAVESYREARRMSPADPGSTKALLAALFHSQQTDEALRVAREAEAFLGADAEFANMRFGLEALAGNRETAIKGREQLLQIYPDFDMNANALIGLYIEAKAWDKARKLIDERRAKHDSLELVRLDATWHADQNDLERGRGVWIDHLDRLTQAGGTLGPEPYLQFGQFLLERGHEGPALAAMTKAAEFQDPTRREADLYRADVLFKRGLYAEAETLYASLVSSGVPDLGPFLTARLAESQIQQKKLDLAERTLSAAGAAVEQDLTLSVLRATIAEQRNDRRRALEILNRAVERFSEEPLPYYRRALLLASDPAYRADALSDLDAAVRLRPGYWPALVARASINLGRGRLNEALTDLRVATETNPVNDDVRETYIVELVRHGRTADAVEAGRAGIATRPNDMVLALRLAETLARMDQWSGAAVFYKHVWENTREPLAAGHYVDALLRSTPPGLSESESVLTSPALPIEQSAELLMLRARLRTMQKLADPAARDAMASYALAASDPRRLAGWYRTLHQVFPSASTRLQIFERVNPHPASAEWLRYFRADTMVSEPPRRTEGIALMERLGNESRDELVRLNCFRALQAVHKADNQPEKALEACLKGIQVAPKDVILNNNAAAILSEDLGRAAEAIPYALVALEGAPSFHSVLDTLATAYLGSGARDKGLEALERALNAAEGPADKSRYLFRLARLYLEAGERGRAGTFTEQIRRLQTENASLLSDDQQRTLEDLEAQIRGIR